MNLIANQPCKHWQTDIESFDRSVLGSVMLSRPLQGFASFSDF